MKYSSIIIFLLGIISCMEPQDTVFQWRGANRAGMYNESKLLKSWQEKSPDLLWFTEEIGDGYAAPVITNDKVLINGMIDSISHLFAFDLHGKLLWKTPNGEEFVGKDFSASFPGARSTPTVFNDLVYICSGLGRVACVALETGEEKWAVDMVANLGGVLSYFGYSESLLVDSNYVYCTPGGANSNVVCLDRFTGKTIWASKAKGSIAAYCSPNIIDLPTIKILVTLTKEYLIGIDMKNGDLLWSHNLDSVKLEGEHCNTPLFYEGHIYYTVAEAKGKGTVKLKLSDDGKSISEVWINPNLKNAFGGFVIDNNKLYATDASKKLMAIDIHTGETVDSLSSANGGLIAANDKQYCYSDNGEVKLIDYKQNKLSLVGKLKIDKGTKEHFSHPVINKGVLYVRHGKALMAYSLIDNS